MSLETGFWRIQNNKPTRITPTAIDYEKRLEEVLQADCSVVSQPRKWLVIGRQVPTDHGGSSTCLPWMRRATSSFLS